MRKRLINHGASRFCVEAVEEAPPRFDCPDTVDIYLVRDRSKLAFPLIDFKAALKNAQVTCLMDSKNKQQDNIIVGLPGRLVKYEKFYLYAYKIVAEARAGIGRYQHFYINRPPHRSFDQMTQDQAYIKALIAIMVAIYSWWKFT